MSDHESDRRLMLVHAHPDDESIFTGVTMAKYVAEGARVTLVTCTAGEEGEILTPDIAHFAAEQDDRLGEHRVDELASAMRALGVEDARFLGGAFGYRDSGMQWGPDGHAMPRDVTRADTFWHADLTDAANELVAIIREVRPHVLVTYDEFGSYGHPDHVQAHRVATYGASLAAVESYRRDLGAGWDVPKVYWTAGSRRLMLEAGWDPDRLPPFAVEDEDLAAVIDGRPWLDQKIAALKAHASQIAADGHFLQGDLNRWSQEFFRLAKGTAAPAAGEQWETDLFAGL
ncbi:MAG TPA: N-acetyl-1-D-myo-inositol-2-amino-2-deoxy-alpha-D-glucopyranoside deacetylase [Aeromicrobium sp.]|nr:N-acetyl-1-D-myo-inositol-2-amino-2-deoxy-alpha-D-glucopyranoside deacetylase [Aeromicrobium sp.]